MNLNFTSIHQLLWFFLKLSIWTVIIESICSRTYTYFKEKANKRLDLTN
jgi:hypothetical protein